jgi:tetratricopeptide (TPR) repeat protein
MAILTIGWDHYQAGRYREAIECSRQVLQADAGNADAWYLEGVASLKLGRKADAESAFKRALRVRLDFTDAYAILGVALAQQGKLDEALTHFQRALELDPNIADVHNNLGCALRDLGRENEAALYFREAVRLNPDHSMALASLVHIYTGRSRFDDVAEILQHVIKVRPQHLEAHVRLGEALFSLKNYQESMTCFERAVHLAPDSAGAHHGLGIALAKLERHDDAVASIRRSLEIQPDQPEAYHNLGETFRDCQQFDSAFEAYAQALSLRPDYPDVHHHRGAALELLSRYDEALASYEQALGIAPEHAHAHTDRSLVWLKQGDFVRGWPEYEWRSKCPGVTIPRYPAPFWMGEPLDGKTILILAEQGLGDTLQFIRYAPLVKERGARVVVVCPRALFPLLEGTAGIDLLIPEGESLPDVDVYATLMSLPGLLKTTLNTIPARIPYVSADPDRIAGWRAKLEPIEGFRIGIAWRGSPKHGRDRQRSFNLERFERLAAIDGVRLISLQKGKGAEEIRHVAGRFRVVDLGEDLDRGPGAFLDTAAIMMNLDLVIVPDTALAHLAGALGVPVWIALALSADWRWLLDREDSPWYPTARLFRQTTLDQWDGPFDRMADVLARRSQSRPMCATVTVEISPGELFDKITILEIKRERLSDAAKRENVITELAVLTQARDRSITSSGDLTGLIDELRAVNEALWQVEDDLRLAERAGDFGSRFIELARSVYRLNDRRAAIKRQLNEHLGSRLIEEKSY